MKKIIMLTLTSAMLVGCKEYADDGALNGENSKDVVLMTFYTNALESDKKNVVVDNNTHNGISGDAKRLIFSRASLVEENITDLYIWEDKTLLCHQSSSDANFGSPSVTLTKGEHSLTFVASKADGQTWTIGSGSDGTEQGVWKCTKVGDTFAAIKTITITASSKAESVELSRRNGRVTWTIEDAIPTATNMTIGVTKQCFGLDASLSGMDAAPYSSTVNISSYAGRSNISVGMMVLPESSGGTEMNATFKVDALCDYATAITVVPNQVCAIHGEFFSDPTPKATVTLSSDWGSTVSYDIR